MQKNTVKETCIVNSIVLFILIISFSITLFITDKFGYYIMLAVSFVLLLTHSKKVFLNMSTKYLFLILLLHLLEKLPYGLGVASFIGLLLIGIKLRKKIKFFEKYLQNFSFSCKIRIGLST